MVSVMKWQQTQVSTRHNITALSSTSARLNDTIERTQPEEKSQIITESPSPKKSKFSSKRRRQGSLEQTTASFILHSIKRLAYKTQPNPRSPQVSSQKQRDDSTPTCKISLYRNEHGNFSWPRSTDRTPNAGNQAGRRVHWVFAHERCNPLLVRIPSSSDMLFPKYKSTRLSRTI
jgi:hypothetical protein